MIYNKPIWSPNVIVFNNYKSDKNFYQKVEGLMKQIESNTKVICVFIDHNYSDKIDSQILLEHTEYSIFKETRKKNNPISAAVLKIGASHVYYIIPKVDMYRAAYVNYMDLMGYNYPLICFSDYLNNDVNAAVIADFQATYDKTNSDLISYTDLLSKRIAFSEKAFAIE